VCPEQGRLVALYRGRAHRYPGRWVSLERKTAVGALWTVTTSVGARVVGLVATLIITRFVAPFEYGEVMAAVAVVETTSFLFNAGLGQYIVVHPEDGPATAFHATVFNWLTGWTGLGLVALLADRLGPALNAPGLAQYVPYLALSMAIDLLAAVPTRILNRDIRFKTLSLGRTLGEFMYSGVGVYLAWKGWGGMSVVMGNLARAIARGMWVIGSVHWREWIEPHRLSWKKTKQLFAFGIPLWASNLAEMGARKWDNLLMVRFFGEAALGKYNFAYNLADVPATHVGEQIGDVLIPSFVRMKDAAARKSALVRSVGLMALVNFPLAVGLGSIADSVVNALFDERWQGMAPMLTLLSVLSVTRPVGWVMQGYILAHNRTRTISVLEMFKALMVVVMLATVGRISVEIACVAVGLAYSLHALVSIWAVKRTDGIEMWRIIRPQIPPLLACVPMAAAVYGVRYAVVHLLGAPVWLSLVAEIVAGALVYVVSGLTIARTQSRELLRIARDILERRRARGDSTPPSTPPSGEPS
jgi:lipopolysaccharide exporter